MTGTGRLSYRAVTELAATTPDDASERTVEERLGLDCRFDGDPAGECFSVRFEEQDAAGLLTENELEFLPGGGTRFSRNGQLSAVFLFRPGEVTMADMVTPYGSVQLHLETDEWELKKNRQQIQLSICYRFTEVPGEVHRISFEICG